MRKSFAIGAGLLVILLSSPMSAKAQQVDKFTGKAPPLNPPQIVVAAEINEHDQLVLVNMRTIYIGFDGASYNNRSLSTASLQDVSILTVAGNRVSIEAARQRIAGKDTPILCSAWKTPLPPFYASIFTPNTLHFVFPKRSPEWKKIQEPGRPLQ